ncbi:MAG: hypothetical protein ACE5EM_12935 [Sphingomonadales bacterium]
MTKNDKFAENYEKVTELGSDELKILESIRFRDQDQSIKAGAILAFSGLLIATTIVQLSAPSESFVSLQENNILLCASKFGLAVLFFVCRFV